MLSISSLGQKQVLRFIFIGMINTLFGYMIFSLFIFIHFTSSLAIIGASIIGIIFNFNTLGRYVFHKPNKHLIFKFISAYFILTIFNITLQKSLHLMISSDYLSGFFSIVITAVLSFLINKHFVFK